MKEKKKRLPMLDDAQAAFAKIPKQLLLAFAAACVFFLICHAGYFDDRTVNEDFRHFLAMNLQRIAIGRFFDFYLITNAMNSWTIGFVACMYLAFATVLAVSMFRVRTKLGVIMTAALMISMPALSYMFGFLAWSPIYARYIFLGVLSVWLADRYKWGVIPGAVVLAVGIGVFQSAMITGAILCVLVLLRDLFFDEEFSYRKLLFKLLKLFVMGVAAVLLYLLMWKIVRHITGIQQSTYRGMNALGQFSLGEILSSLKQSYGDFLGFFFGTRFFYVSKLQKIVYFIFFLSGWVAVVFSAVKHPVRIPGMLVGLLLIPPCLGCIEILVPEMETDTLMVYSIVFFQVLAVRLAEDSMPDNKLGTVSAWILILSLVITCFSNLDISSSAYVKSETYDEHTRAYENRLLSRIEETPGYYQGIPVAIITNTTTDYMGLSSDDFPHVINNRGLWYSYVGSYTNVMMKTINLIKNYTGVALTSATDEQVESIRASAEFNELSPYPLEGSTRVINGVLTVNTIHREVKMQQAGEHAVLLQYVDHTVTDEALKYAWYVFRDGERVEELGRNYTQNPYFFADLTEDGRYTFQGFCMNGSEKKSIKTVSVIVEDGEIQPNANLGSVSLEDAIALTLEPMEVSVTLYGARGVKLTMIDNTLDAGPEYTYAWYVYKDGKHLEEYTRWYTDDPEYDLILAEEGEYQFKLFCKKGKETFSVMSRKVVIGQAGSQEAAA